MLERTVSQHGVRLTDSWLVGNIEMARSTDCHSILVLTGYGRRFQRHARAEFTAEDLSRAAATIAKGTLATP